MLRLCISLFNVSLCSQFCRTFRWKQFRFHKAWQRKEIKRFLNSPQNFCRIGSDTICMKCFHLSSFELCPLARSLTYNQLNIAAFEIFSFLSFLNILIVIHTSSFNSGTATYTIYNSNTITKVPYSTNKTCYTMWLLTFSYTTYTIYNTIRLQMLLPILQHA